MALRKPDSFTSCRISLRLQRVFDLRNARNLAAYADVVATIKIPADIRDLGRSVRARRALHPVSATKIKQALTAIDWRYLPMQFELPSFPQVFGRTLLDAGFEGVIFPSTKGTADCMAIFPENLLIGSWARLTDTPPDTSVQTELTAESYQALLGD